MLKPEMFVLVCQNIITTIKTDYDFGSYGLQNTKCVTISEEKYFIYFLHLELS